MVTIASRISGRPPTLRPTSLLLTACLLTTCAPPDCATWNTEAFFRLATPGDTRTCLQAGADVSARDSTDLTPLHLAAAWNENPEVALTLIRAGADIHALDDYFGTSAMRRAPLDMAARYNGNPQVALAFLGAGARAETRHLLGAAISNGNPEVALTFVRAGVDVNATNPGGPTALSLAARANRNPEMVLDLVRAGADLDARAGQLDEAPLHLAAANNENPEVALALINAGSDVNAGNGHGDTPLLRALYANENPEVALALIEAGADVDARELATSATPLHRAASFSRGLDVAKALIRAGADLNARSARGETPLHWAADADNTDTLNAPARGRRRCVGPRLHWPHASGGRRAQRQFRSGCDTPPRGRLSLTAAPPTLRDHLPLPPRQPQQVLLEIPPARRPRERRALPREPVRLLGHHDQVVRLARPDQRLDQLHRG